MKTLVILVIAAGVLGISTVFTHAAFAQSSGDSAQTKAVSPLYCNRTAIPAEERQHKDELNRKLRSSHRSIHELGYGYEFELPSDTATVQAAAEWAALERLCCPFFDIELRWECENGPFFLRLTGRDGVKQFIRSEFAPWFQQAM